MPPSEKADSKELSGREKVAVLMVALGADVAPEVYKRLDDSTIELITLEIANLRKITPDIKLTVLKEAQEILPKLVEKLEKVFARLLTEAKHIHKTAQTFGADTDEIAYYLANSFRVLSRHRMKLYPAVPELLQHLRDCGKGVYMLSNAQAVFTTPEIEQLDLAKYFDDIFLSSDIGVKKPEPLFFEKLLQKHSLDPAKTVMVGNDLYADMGIALACGIAGAHINSDKLSARERAKQKKMLEMEYGRGTDEIYEFQSIRELLKAVTAQ